MKSCIAIGIVAGALAACTVQVQPPAPSSALPDGRPIVPPFGMVQWCQTQGDAGGAEDDLCRCWRLRDASAPARRAVGCSSESARRAPDGRGE